MPADQRKARKSSPGEKLQILREGEQSGKGVAVAQKYQIHPHTVVERFIRNLQGKAGPGRCLI
jgi:transposase-like protein